MASNLAPMTADYSAVNLVVPKASDSVPKRVDYLVPRKAVESEHHSVQY